MIKLHPTKKEDDLIDKEGDNTNKKTNNTDNLKVPISYNILRNKNTSR